MWNSIVSVPDCCLFIYWNVEIWSYFWDRFFMLKYGPTVGGQKLSTRGSVFYVEIWSDCRWSKVVHARISFLCWNMVRLSVIKSCPREDQFFMLKYGPTVGDQKLSTRGLVFYVEIWSDCRWSKVVHARISFLCWNMVRLSVIKSCPREGQFFMLKYGPTVGDQKLSTRGSVFYVEIWSDCRWSKVVHARVSFLCWNMVRLSVIKSCPREYQFFMLKYGPTVGDQKLSTRGSVFLC